MDVPIMSSERRCRTASLALPIAQFVREVSGNITKVANHLGITYGTSTVMLEELYIARKGEFEWADGDRELRLKIAGTCDACPQQGELGMCKYMDESSQCELERRYAVCPEE